MCGDFLFAVGSFVGAVAVVVVVVVDVIVLVDGITTIATASGFKY